MAIDVKICGLNDRPSLDAALRHGARMTGFVFFERSPRHVTFEEAAALARHVPEGVERVGVTVDAGDDLLRQAIAAARLSVVQFHGAEDVHRLAEVRARFGVKVMKVIRVAGPGDLDATPEFSSVADVVMFDAAPPKGATRPGGNATAFDWRILQERRVASPWILSGGLDAGNLREAVGTSGARAVDVSSGVETAPGRKSPDLVREFMEQAAGI